MARIRTIKPEFWSSEQVMECQALTRLLFIGIWNFCDDGGNHPDSEKTIKARVFPGDEISSSSIRRMLDELSSNGLLAFYEHSGKRYLHVSGWEHQRIDKPTFKYPEFVQSPAMSSPPLLGLALMTTKSRGLEVILSASPLRSFAYLSTSPRRILY